MVNALELFTFLYKITIRYYEESNDISNSGEIVMTRFYVKTW